MLKEIEPIEDNTAKIITNPARVKITTFEIILNFLGVNSIEFVQL